MIGLRMCSQGSRFPFVRNYLRYRRPSFPKCGGSGVLRSKVITRVAMAMTLFRALRTLLLSSHEPSRPTPQNPKP